MRSASHTGLFKYEWLEQVIFLYVASTVALPVKLLFQYLHLVMHFNVMYLISSAGSNICAVSHTLCFVNTNSSRESVGKAKVISESN